MRRAPKNIRLALCLAAGLVACDPPDEPEADGGPEGLPPILLSQVLFEGYSGALRDVVVRSRNARVDARGRVAKLEDVRIRLDSDERGSFEVSSPRGELDLRTDDFKLEGGVEGQTDGVRFKTDEVRYDEASGWLRSESPVELVRPNMTLRARRMEMHLGDERIHLLGDVVAHMVRR